MRFWRAARQPPILGRFSRPCASIAFVRSGSCWRALSAWLARELCTRGLAVEVIDARQAHAVMPLRHNKTDAGDAELLAEKTSETTVFPVMTKGSREPG